MAPGEFLAVFNGAIAAELGLEAAGFCGGGEEEIAAGDALLQIGGAVWCRCWDPRRPDLHAWGHRPLVECRLPLERN